MAAYRDLDLVLAVVPDQLVARVPDRTRLAAALGPLFAAFTGEHVGEPTIAPRR